MKLALTRPRLAGESDAGRRRSGPAGQAVVEAALAFTVMVLLFTAVVSVGQGINYAVGLTNAASAAATAAALEAQKGASGNPSQQAVAAVNQEQNSSSWTACGGTPTPPCVSVTSASHNTGGSTTVTVEQVTVRGTFTPIFNVLGLSFPITVNSAAKV